jgi:hypothetical protein
LWLKIPQELTNLRAWAAGGKKRSTPVRLLNYPAFYLRIRHAAIIFPNFAFGIRLEISDGKRLWNYLAWKNVTEDDCGIIWLGKM